MKTLRNRSCLIAMLLLAEFSIVTGAFCEGAPPPTVTLTQTNAIKRYVVRLKSDADQDQCAKEHAVSRSRSFRHALNGFVADLTETAANRLRADPRVQGLMEDRIAAQNCDQIIPAGVLRMAVAQFPPVKIDGTDKRVNVDIAVMDDGVQTDHPDLNVVQAVSFNGSDQNSGHGTA